MSFVRYLLTPVLQHQVRAIVSRRRKDKKRHNAEGRRARPLSFAGLLVYKNIPGFAININGQYHMGVPPGLRSHRVSYPGFVFTF